MYTCKYLEKKGWKRNEPILEVWKKKKPKKRQKKRNNIHEDRKEWPESKDTIEKNQQVINFVFKKVIMWKTSHRLDKEKERRWKTMLRINGGHKYHFNEL